MCFRQKKLPKIRFPKSENELREAASKYTKLNGIESSGNIAALDEIAIKIQQPLLKDASDPKKYYNRKKCFAICVQAAVTADYKFFLCRQKIREERMIQLSFNPLHFTVS